jgi:hypothetical protein
VADGFVGFAIRKKLASGEGTIRRGCNAWVIEFRSEQLHLEREGGRVPMPTPVLLNSDFITVSIDFKARQHHCAGN